MSLVALLHSPYLRRSLLLLHHSQGNSRRGEKAQLSSETRHKFHYLMFVLALWLADYSERGGSR